MKHLLLFSVFLLLAGTVSAQQKKTSPPEKTASSKTPSAPAKDSALCKAWKLAAVEEFAVKGVPTEQQQKDAATFMADKTAFVTLNGKQMTGTWELDKPKAYITFTEDGTGAKTRFKLVKVNDTELVYEWQDPETLIRTLYYFEPLKK